MDHREFLDDLLVVVVLYRKKPEESIALASLESALRNAAPLPALLVYDNSPQRAESSLNYGHYVHNPQNRGTSYAYNQAALHARMTNKSWMLLLDQDTEVNEDFFKALVRTVGIYRDSAVFAPRVLDSKGLLSPFRFVLGKGKRAPACPEIMPLDRYRFINSGLTVRVAALEAAGGYDERIPLDFGDISFGERLRSRNVTDHFRLVDASLKQEFADNESVPVERALDRFSFFLTGSRVMSEYGGSSVMYAFNSFIRACRLCLRYADFRFLALLTHRNHV